MTLSGTYTQGFTNNGAFRLRVAWSATQNINENYSTVTAHLYIDSLQSWASVYDGTSSACAITINGNRKPFSNNSTIGAWESKWLGSHTVNVYHNSDGTKQFTISAEHYFDITWNGSFVGNITLSGSAWLNTIPRATTPVLSNYDPVMGETITISLPRASDSFTHYVYHDFYVGSWTQANNEVITGTSFIWTVPLEEYAQRIPNAAAGSGRIQVDTWNGSTYIGSKIVNFTAYLPASAIPTIDTATIAEAVAGLAAKFGAYVQFKSKLALSMAASGVYGSTISAYKITANGTAYNAASATTNELVASGVQNVIFEATDSRGRKATQTVAITVIAYSQPSILSIAASRVDAGGASDDEGIYAKVVFKTAIAPVNNLNDKLLEIKMRKVGMETWTTAYSDSLAYVYDTFQVVAGFDGDYAYDIQVVVTDYFSVTTPATLSTTLSTAFTLVDYFAGGKGLAFGKVASKEGFENNLKTWFTGGIETIALPIGDGTLAYWQTIPGGFYHAVLGSVTGQPRPSGLIHVIRNGTDFSAMWYDMASRNIYRLYGSATTLNQWTLASGTPATFSPTLQNGWANYGDGFTAAEYWKDSDNVVHVSGLIKDGGTADGTVIFTLPVGFRPGLKQLFPSTLSSGIGRIDVNDNGNVVAKIVNATYTSLSGISFRAEN